MFTNESNLLFNIGQVLQHLPNFLFVHVFLFIRS